MRRIVVRSVTSERGSQNPTDSNGQIWLLFIFMCVFLSILSCMNRKQIVIICETGRRAYGLKMDAYVKNRRS